MVGIALNKIQRNSENRIEQENVLFEHWILYIGSHFSSWSTNINPDYKKTGFYRFYLLGKYSSVNWIDEILCL